MLKFIPFLLFFVFLMAESTAQMRYGQYAHAGQIAYIMEQTDIKDKPFADSRLVVRLQTGKKVQVDGISKSEYSKNGYIANWYQISFRQDGALRKGYVWGGALSAIALPFTSSMGKDLFLFGIAEFNEKTGFMAVAKIIRNGKEIAKSVMPAISFSEDGHYEYCLQGKVIGKRGFSNLSSIFEISSTYAACGYPNVNSLIFWNGRDLKLGAQGMQMAEAGYGSIETEVIFPDQIGGKPNQLMLIETHEEYYGDMVVNRKIVRKNLRWNGKDLKE